MPRACHSASSRPSPASERGATNVRCPHLVHCHAASYLRGTVYGTRWAFGVNSLDGFPHWGHGSGLMSSADIAWLASLQARTWGPRSHDFSGATARVVFSHPVGPENGIGRFRGGIGGPKVAPACQADPELVWLPGRSRSRISQIHQRSTALAAHLQVGIRHWLDSSAKPSGCLGGLSCPTARAVRMR
jgi:hypothetical protein